VAIGFWAPILVGWWALRHERHHVAEPSPEHRGMAILKEAITNGQALFAFFALSSVDIIVARNVMGADEAGLYAAGLILTKAMLFLPQFVVVVAFPSMASSGGERRRALVLSVSLVAVLGVVGTLASWLLSSIALRFVGGSQYVDVEPRLWLFAVLGTLLSMIQLLVYSVLARQARASTYLVWVALLVLIGLGLTTSSVLGLALVVLVVDSALFVVLLAISVWFLRKDDPAEDADDAAESALHGPV